MWQKVEMIDLNPLFATMYKTMIEHDKNNEVVKIKDFLVILKTWSRTFYILHCFEMCWPISV